jgi:sugar lactone lactonase YvrE
MRRTLSLLCLLALAAAGCSDSGEEPKDGGADALVCGSTQCKIEGACVNKGATDPKDTCKTCDPTFSTTFWAPSSGCILTLAGGGTGSQIDGPRLQAQFLSPADVAAAAPGKVYVADRSNHRIRLIDGDRVSTVAGSSKNGSDNGPLSKATFDNPNGVAVDSGGKIYVADTSNNLIRLISGSAVSTFAGSGKAGADNGAAQSATFQFPRDVALDSAGTLHVADGDNYLVRSISAGQVSTLAGTGMPGASDGKLASASFSRFQGLAVASTGTLYVADTNNHRIRSISGGEVKTVAGSGPLGTTGGAFKDGDALKEARFKSPTGVAVASNGDVYVADAGNHAIRKLSGGKVTTVAGEGGLFGYGDGPATKGRFNTPQDLCFDSAGYLYVADSANHVIRVLKP